MDTSTSRNICYFLIITYLVNSDYSRAMRIPQREEPRCNSQFEYEYKVIQKLVELETSQKDFQEIIKKQEETLRKRDETITALEADIQSLSDKLNDVDRKLQEGETKINGVNQNFEIVQMLKNITGKILFLVCVCVCACVRACVQKHCHITPVCELIVHSKPFAFNKNAYRCRLPKSRRREDRG